MMTADLSRKGSVPGLSLLGLLVVNAFLVVVLGNQNVVFEVQHKFKGLRGGNGGGSLLTSLKAHDSYRHGRMLSAIDVPLGGNGSPTDAALYFTKLSLGTPPQDYYVQVDTGSDILWVNCAGCDKCPKKSSLGIDLTLYDSEASSTAKSVTCDQDFCLSAFNSQSSPDCKVGFPCEYSVTYGDGSTTGGFFVRDYATFNQVSGNLQTKPMNGTVVFGCSSQQSGELGSSTEAVDGIVGFGQANSSIISQLASSGKVKKVFSHCLDGVNGGGIFAIGEVVQPKLNTTPLVPNEPHYNVIMMGIEVGGDVLELPTDVFGSGTGSGTIIDSGTTLAYLPDDVYAPFMKKIMASQPNLQTHIVEGQFTCFVYSGNIDDGFPVVTFHFEDSLSLTVYPHEYLFNLQDDQWCVGWQNKGLQTRDGKEMTLLGDLVLSNKLVMYNLENQTIGWAEYNCSSSIKVRDHNSGNVYSVGSHDLSSACCLNIEKFSRFLLLIGIPLFLFDFIK